MEKSTKLDSGVIIWSEGDEIGVAIECPGMDAVCAMFTMESAEKMIEAIEEQILKAKVHRMMGHGSKKWQQSR